MRKLAFWLLAGFLVTIGLSTLARLLIEALKQDTEQKPV